MISLVTLQEKVQHEDQAGRTILESTNQQLGWSSQAEGELGLLMVLPFPFQLFWEKGSCQPLLFLPPFYIELFPSHGDLDQDGPSVNACASHQLQVEEAGSTPGSSLQLLPE